MGGGPGGGVGAPGFCPGCEGVWLPELATEGGGKIISIGRLAGDSRFGAGSCKGDVCFRLPSASTLMPGI